MKSICLVLLLACSLPTLAQAKSNFDDYSVSYFINPKFQDKIDKAKMSLDGPDGPLFPDFRGAELFGDYQDAINLAFKDGMKCQNPLEGFWKPSEILGATNDRDQPIAQKAIWCYIDPIKSWPSYHFEFTALGRLSSLDYSFWSEEPPEEATKTLQNKFPNRKFSLDCPIKAYDSCFSENRVSGKFTSVNDESIIELKFWNNDKKLVNGKYNYKYYFIMNVLSELDEADLNAMKEQLTDKTEFRKTDF